MFWPQVTKRVILSPASTSSSGVLGRRFSSPKTVSCQLFLFQKTVMLCKTTENLSEPHNPHLLNGRENLAKKVNGKGGYSPPPIADGIFSKN